MVEPVKADEYRVLQFADGNLGIVLVSYEDPNSKRVIYTTTDPEDGSVGPVGRDIDDLRVNLAQLSQALESPVLQLSNLPGSDDYVSPNEEPLPTAFTETGVSDPGSPAEPIDDGKAFHVPEHLRVEPTVDPATLEDEPVVDSVTTVHGEAESDEVLPGQDDPKSRDFVEGRQIEHGGEAGGA